MANFTIHIIPDKMRPLILLLNFPQYAPTSNAVHYGNLLFQVWLKKIFIYPIKPEIWSDTKNCPFKNKKLFNALVLDQVENTDKGVLLQ